VAGGGIFVIKNNNMKTQYILTAIVVLLALTTTNNSFAQTNDDKEITRLEQLEAASIKKGDTTTLLKLWSKDFVCNNPYGYIVTPLQVIKFIKAGQIEYSSYERDIERITFTGDLAIVMGKEVVMPQRKTPGAGKTITMRYTHVWIKTGYGWRLTARQASNF
jgi:ketosteroid isomerase-like protein